MQEKMSISGVHTFRKLTSSARAVFVGR